jgi:putative ATP-dependent endonuclease of OLD family
VSAAVKPQANFVIRDVRIQDFRAVRDLCVPLSKGTTVFIGANNSGKTSLLEALASAFGSRPSTEDDLFVAPDGRRAPSFVVDLKLAPIDSDNFDDLARGLFAEAIQPPTPPDTNEYVVVRCIGEPNPDGSGLSIRRNFIQGWACGRDAALALREVPRGRVGRAILDLFEFSYVDARRDIVSDLRSRTSAWGRIISNLGLDSETQTALEGELTKLNKRLIDASSVLKLLTDALARVREAMSTATDEIAITPLPVRADELGRAIDILVTASGSAAVPIRMQGMGGRSLSALLVYQSLVELRLGLNRPVRPLAISAIEEPEAHLHPQAQRATLPILTRIAGQKLISTHSPYVASYAGLYDLRVLRRRGPEVLGRRLEAQLTAEQQTAVTRFVQHRHGEILFARLVILCEGPSEEAALRVFSAARWQLPSPEALGISFVSADGAGGFTSIVPVLDNLGVPWLVLIDRDQAGHDALKSITNSLGRQVDENTPEIIMLSGSPGFEGYLVSEGLQEPIREAVASYYGPNALEDYRAHAHGKPYRHGQGTRDYQSAGWEDRLLVDFLHERKGTYGKSVAEAIVAAGNSGKAAIPSAIRELCDRADRILS